MLKRMRAAVIAHRGDTGDQGAYLGYARHLYDSNYTVTEDRNRMPAYPSFVPDLSAGNDGRRIPPSIAKFHG